MSCPSQAPLLPLWWPDRRTPDRTRPAPPDSHLSRGRPLTADTSGLPHLGGPHQSRWPFSGRSGPVVVDLLRSDQSVLDAANKEYIVGSAGPSRGRELRPCSLDIRLHGGHTHRLAIGLAQPAGDRALVHSLEQVLQRLPLAVRQPHSLEQSSCH